MKNIILPLIIGSFFTTGLSYAQGGRPQGPPPPGKFIEMLDSDGDGKVSQDEFRGPKEHFQHFDQNNDGFISGNEVPQGPPMGQGQGLGGNMQNMGPGQGGMHQGPPGMMGQGQGGMQHGPPPGMMGQGQSGSRQGPPGMMGQNSGEAKLMDVHGAGAQRSDPKSGDPGKYSSGHGPQGDVVRVYNYARCVRGGLRDLDVLSNSYQVVDTGQTACYDDGDDGKLRRCPGKGTEFYGQDAQYKGAHPGYIDNGDGTITDKNTGLMWQKRFSKMSWNDAFSAAKSLNTGGYNDWRVPSTKELYSLINFNGITGTGRVESSQVPSDAVPYLDTEYFDFEYPTENRYIDAQYITNTVYVSTVMGGQEVFFGVNFADGRIKGYPKTGNMSRSSFYVLFVRGNPDYGKNDFQDNGNQTIHDQATGLTWTKGDSGDAAFLNTVSRSSKKDGSLNWDEALSFCENLDFGGASDWRLPNAKELHSIVDYSRSPDTTDSAAIDPIFSTTAIKDEGGARDFPFYWSSTTHLDGKNLGEWAIYISFGEAHGFMGGQKQSKKRPRRPRRNRN